MDENIKILTDRSDIVAIADAVRSKTGTTAEMTLGGIITGIHGIETGVDLPELTNEGTAADMLSGKQLIDSDGNVVTGSIPTVTQATPSVSVNSNGLITASATQTAGYVSAGTKSATKQLTTKGAATITPTTTSQIVVSAGTYVTGNIIVGAASGGEDKSDEDAIITGTLHEYTNNRVATIGSSAFIGCNSLTSVSFPNVTAIGASAFNGCFNLMSVNFPNVTTIGDSAFENTRITSVNFPNVTTIGARAFSGCNSLTSVELPNVTIIRSSAFDGCDNLTSVELSNVIAIETSAFDGCNSLTSVELPNVTTIGARAFNGCDNLTSLYLLGSSVCVLLEYTAFSDTPMKNTGSIYVPEHLLNDYKNATNWSAYADRFVGVDTGDSESGGDDAIINFVIDGISCQATNGMTWREWVYSDYNILNYEIDTDNTIMTPDIVWVKDPLTYNYVDADESIRKNIEYYTEG